MNRDCILVEPFGPVYPDLGAAVAKHRRSARDGLATLSKAERQTYGEAVELAIRAKQRSELQRELPSRNCHCASGTNHNTGAAIHKAMQAKHRAALAACPSQERRARPAHEWQRMYEEAMAEKAAAPRSIRQLAAE